ncbi:hypothetical protein EH2_03895 [Bacillus subtilis]|nr:hypothetical protein EH2_03895 [Bacillus subtilis]
MTFSLIGNPTRSLLFLLDLFFKKVIDIKNSIMLLLKV